MAATPEREPKVKIPEGVIEYPAEVPYEVERAGLKPRATQFTQQVSDDTGQPLIQTPKAKVVTIQLPADKIQLTQWSKGSAASSLTWFAMFWLRMVKKAMHFGWKTVDKFRLPGK